ncbi:MAG: large conductance mechanosensitive channel protein MscL [Clostridia bacterium]|nr:large conductance mechanosensitive channel protein MscL [Clostridia bacterium]
MKKLKKPEFKLIKEFKKFITKGNVVDLAVGMIIGAAFTAIVNALVNNIFKPLINAIPLGGVEGLVTMLVEKNADGLTAAQVPAGTEFVVDLTKSVYIDWGAFIMAIVNFFLTAMVLFAIIKLINKFREGMGGMKNKAELVASLTDEEKATCKNPLVPRKKELKAIVQARADKEAAKKAEEEAAAAAAAAEKETTEDILKDIRDLLKRD